MLHLLNSNEWGNGRTDDLYMAIYNLPSSSLVMSPLLSSLSSQVFYLVLKLIATCDED
jgi:hypothetical protein